MGAPSRRRVPPLPATRLTPKCASRTLSARCSATPRRSARRQPHSAAQRRHVRCCVNEACRLHRVRGAAAWQGRVARWALACAPPASVQRCSLAHSVARLPHCPDLQRIWFRAHAYVCHCGTLAHRHTASACPRVRVGTQAPGRRSEGRRRVTPPRRRPRPNQCHDPTRPQKLWHHVFIHFSHYDNFKVCDW